MTEVQGRKDDAGKLRFSLIPFDALESVVEILELGAAHYGDDNWRRVPNARARYFNAFCRHVVLGWWLRREWLDPDSGKPHLAHGICCLLFLLAHPETKGK